MDSIYRGEVISHLQFIDKIDDLKSTINKDLLSNKLTPEIIIADIDKLSSEINKDEVINEINALGIPKWAALDYINVLINGFNRNELTKKINKELGVNSFEWKKIDENIEEKDYPQGVILHIGAGNALGLSVFSVIEGLLTGNINILKLPEHEGGVSVKLLIRLIEIEPLLKPFIYVIDISSKNQSVIKQLINIVDVVTIWGSDNAIKSIRNITPPDIPIVEWGHKLSFAYFTKNDKNEIDLQGLAKEVIITDQLYCSSPQCVFYETDSNEELDNFAAKLAHYLEVYSIQYPTLDRPIDIESNITWTHELIKMEELLNQKKLIKNNKASVMIDYNAKLTISPQFRNIWLMPIKRENIFNILRSHKGHLQTVGLSCKTEELEELSSIFYSAGVNRVTSVGYMSSNYSGEPHDGVSALQNYVRKVNRRIIK